MLMVVAVEASMLAKLMAEVGGQCSLPPAPHPAFCIPYSAIDLASHARVVA